MSTVARRVAALERKSTREAIGAQTMREWHERNAAAVEARHAMSEEEWRREYLAVSIMVEEVLDGPAAMTAERIAAIEEEVARTPMPIWHVSPPGIFPPRDGPVDPDVLAIIDPPPAKVIGGFGEQARSR